MPNTLPIVAALFYQGYVFFECSYKNLKCRKVNPSRPHMKKNQLYALNLFDKVVCILDKILHQGKFLGCDGVLDAV